MMFLKSPERRQHCTQIITIGLWSVYHEFSQKHCVVVTWEFTMLHDVLHDLREVRIITDIIITKLSQSIILRDRIYTENMR